MRIENYFLIGLPVAEAWQTLLDIPRIAVCMPGAELLEIVDENTYRGQVKAKLGPVAVVFKGTAKVIEKDERVRRVRMTASGTEAKGRGGAEAKVAFSLSPFGQETRVDIVTDLNLSGAVAQYGRAQGIISGVAQQIIDQFAENLRVLISGSRDEMEAAAMRAQKGLSIWALLLAYLRKLFLNKETFAK